MDGLSSSLDALCLGASSVRGLSIFKVIKGSGDAITCRSDRLLSELLPILLRLDLSEGDRDRDLLCDRTVSGSGSICNGFVIGEGSKSKDDNDDDDIDDKRSLGGTLSTSLLCGPEILGAFCAVFCPSPFWFSAEFFLPPEALADFLLLMLSSAKLSIPVLGRASGFLLLGELSGDRSRAANAIVSKACCRDSATSIGKAPSDDELVFGW